MGKYLDQLKAEDKSSEEVDLDSIVIRQQQRIRELENVHIAMLDWWVEYEGLRDKDRKGLHHIFEGTKGHRALHHIFDMVFANMRGYGVQTRSVKP